MLCGIQSSHNHHHHPRRYFLQRFRSHKSLKACADCDYPGAARVIRKHTDSDPNSLASPRPSTTSRRSEMFVDWDPLRLHPPTTPGPSPPLQPEEFASRRHHCHHSNDELRHVHSNRALRPRTYTSPSSGNTVIYDGFDFGFTSQPQQHPSIPTILKTPPSRGRAPSPAPSDISSGSSFRRPSSSLTSLSSVSSTLPSSEDEEEMILKVGGLAPAPQSWTRPRPRPKVQHEDDGFDESGEFYRRGGWKRRGIVFVNPDVDLSGTGQFMI
ncbi:uncharacterized protein CTHT_0014450 [Thermochaetoides thermophila DSM 1495]|uniref:Uncharacterized protein n=1 Tax=Chaetomium thermophilum (strain DSM 1495 / CBS 144.50 / IMI 039719) TaxID=759272 RepID=G0S1Q6_CHATD|nr:hypothetical protein CTHT_0014450 [Thermochaetoides thermophila DSM 1495]EGS22966.1 hypothetical protein CTHT_0014450 [Thermochaetoides thermophila DSM 1495]